MTLSKNSIASETTLLLGRLVSGPCREDTAGRIAATAVVHDLCVVTRNLVPANGGAAPGPWTGTHPRSARLSWQGWACVAGIAIAGLAAFVSASQWTPAFRCATGGMTN